VIAAAEIHARVDSQRIVAKHAFDRTVPLDEQVPIEGPQFAQARDAVLDGNLVSPLTLAILLQGPFERRILRCRVLYSTWS
jgi:hypothetical protein